jgi:membrane protein
VYGSLAAAFVFMLWLYLSWTIFLFGARLAFVLQHHRSLLEPDGGDAMGRDLLAVRALVEVALAWWDGAEAPDAGEVADRLDAPAEPVREVLASLEQAGFLSESDDGRLVPGRPLTKISLAEVRRVIVGAPTRSPQKGLASRLAAHLEGGEGAAVLHLSNTTIHDLCRAERPGNAAPDGPPDRAPGDPSARIPA